MIEEFKLFCSSVERLTEVLDEKPSMITRDASIQRFEFTFELAWKVVQKYLSSKQIICRSPRECLKEAFNLQIITNENEWLSMLNDRNLTSHAYNEKLSEEIFGRLSDHLALLTALRDNLKKLIENN